MQNRQVGRWLWRVFLGSVLALTILLACGLGVQKIHDWRIEHAIARYRAAPSAPCGARLTQWLAEGSVTREQGTRILTALLRPTIVARAAYPVGQSVSISVERPFPLTIRGSRIEFQEHVWGAGRLMDSSWLSRSTLYGFPEILNAWTEPTEPGIYHARIRTTCKVVGTTGRKFTLWDRLSIRLRRLFGRPPAARASATTPTIYECRFFVPFGLNIVEKDRAERLELIADPPTDDIMRAAIATETSDRHGAYETAAGRRGHRGSASVTFKTLPIATAFELSLRLADGRELPAGPRRRQPQRIRVRAGKSATFVVNVGDFGITQPGNYAGTLVLRPDPNYAYEDPAIKSIWNGTLEFPIAFMVYVRTQTE